METATVLDSTDLQTPTLEHESPQDPYSGLKKLAQAAQTMQSEPPTHNNHFDRYIEYQGHEAPHWKAWLKAI